MLKVVVLAEKKSEYEIINRFKTYDLKEKFYISYFYVQENSRSFAFADMYIFFIIDVFPIHLLCQVSDDGSTDEDEEEDEVEIRQNTFFDDHEDDRQFLVKNDLVGQENKYIHYNPDHSNKNKQWAWRN